MSEDHEDVRLLRAWQAGDRDSGTLLVGRHFERVYRFFATKIADQADDLTQKTFSDIQDRVVVAGRDVESFRAYVMKVARNNLYMLIRSRATRERTFDPSAYSVATMVPAPTPTKVIGQRREERLLLEGLRMIPLQAQVTVELFYWERLSVKEIAEVLEVAPGTVMSRLSRARERLREAIEGLTDDRELLESTVSTLDAWARGIRDAL